MKIGRCHGGEIPGNEGIVISSPRFFDLPNRVIKIPISIQIGWNFLKAEGGSLNRNLIYFVLRKQENEIGILSERVVSGYS